MKTINGFLTSFLLLIASFQLNAQSDHHWHELGDRGFGMNTTYDPFLFSNDLIDIEISADSVPHMAFIDQDTMLNVMKHNGTDWVQVGNPDFAKAMELDMEFAPNGDIYIVFRDITGASVADAFNPSLSEGSTSLMLYKPSVGGNWSYAVGGMKTGRGFSQQLEFNSNGEPVVLHNTSNGIIPLVRYSPNDGGHFFTQIVDIGGSSTDVKLTLDNSDNWSIAYIKQTFPQKGMVRRQNSGTAEYRSGTMKSHDIAVASNGDHYVAHNDGASLQLYRSALGTGTWTLLDAVAIASSTHEVSIKMDSNDSLMIGTLLNQKPSVWTLDADTLKYVGSNQFIQSNSVNYDLLDLEFVHDGKPIVSVSHDDSISVIRTCTQPVHWTGGGGNMLWSDPDNWSCKRVPIDSDDVVIDIQTASAPVIVPQGHFALIKSLNLAHKNSHLYVVGSLIITNSEGNGLISYSDSLNIASPGNLLIQNTSGIGILQKGGKIRNNGSLQVLNSGSNGIQLQSDHFAMNRNKTFLNDIDGNIFINNSLNTGLLVLGDSAVVHNKGDLYISGGFTGIRALNMGAVIENDSTIQISKSTINGVSLGQSSLLTNTGKIDIEDTALNGIDMNKSSILENSVSGRINILKVDSTYSAETGISSTDTSNIENDGIINISDVRMDGVCNLSASTLNNNLTGFISLSQNSSLTGMNNGIINDGLFSALKNKGQIDVTRAKTAFTNQNCGKVTNEAGSANLKNGKSAFFIGVMNFDSSTRAGFLNKNICTEFKNEGNVNITDSSEDGICNQDGASVLNRLSGKLSIFKKYTPKSAKRGIYNTGDNTMLENEGQITISDADTSVVNLNCGMILNQTGSTTSVKSGQKKFIPGSILSRLAKEISIMNKGKCTKLDNQGYINIEDANAVGLWNSEGAIVSNKSTGKVNVDKKTAMVSAIVGIVNSGDASLIENEGEIIITDVLVDGIQNDSAAIFNNGSEMNTSFNAKSANGVLARFVQISSTTTRFNRGFVNRGRFSVFRNFGTFNISGFRSTGISNRSSAVLSNRIGGRFNLTGLRSSVFSLKSETDISKSNNVDIEIGILNTGDSTLFENLGEIEIQDISEDGICNDSAAIFINGEEPTSTFKSGKSAATSARFVQIRNTRTGFRNIGRRSTSRNYGSLVFRDFSFSGLSNARRGSFINYSGGSLSFRGLRSFSALQEGVKEVAKNANSSSGEQGIINSGDSTSIENFGNITITNTMSNGMMNMDSAKVTNQMGGQILIDSIENNVAIVNSSCLLNEMDATIELKAAVSNSDSVINKGLILLEYAGNHTNTGYIQNNGLVDDVLPGSNFTTLVDNETVMAVPISGTRANPISNTLKISANYTELTVGSNWYTDSTLTNIAGTYDSQANEFIPDCALPLGLSKIWMKSTYSGMSASDTVPILITISAAPVILTCKDSNVSLGSDGTVALLPSMVVDDDGPCDNLSFQFTGGLTSFGCADLGNQYMVTIQGTDEVGANKSCSSTITIVDEAGPNMICKPATVVLDKNGQGSILLTDVVDLNSSFDQCGNSVTADSLSQLDFTCADVGIQSVTVFGSDGLNNVGTCSASIQVVNPLNQRDVAELIGPEVVCPGQGGITYDLVTDLDVNYNWNVFGSGLTLDGGQGTNSISTKVASGLVSSFVIANVSNACSSVQESLTVISAPPAICQFSNCADSSFIQTFLLNSFAPDIFHVDRVISSNAVVSSKDFTFRSGQNIQLEPGFEVVNGTAFKAEIMPCNIGRIWTDDEISILQKSIEKTNERKPIEVIKERENDKDKKVFLKNGAIINLHTGQKQSHKKPCLLDINEDGVCDDEDKYLQNPKQK